MGKYEQENEIRNPGCKYCKFYMGESYSGREGGVCIQNARVKKRADKLSQVYRYIDCQVPGIKNNFHLCRDFKMEHFIFRILRKLKILPPRFTSANFDNAALMGESWWNDELDSSAGH